MAMVPTRCEYREMMQANAMSVEIRIATACDAACACLVLRRSISECCTEDHRNDAAILDAWLGNKTAENVASWFLSPSNFSIVAVVDQAIAGVALLTRTGKIVLCYVTPELRFTGIGKALLQALEQQAREWNIRSLSVISTATAKSFYSHNGYVQGTITRSVFGIDVISFSKRLTACSYPKKPSCGCDS